MPTLGHIVVACMLVAASPPARADESPRLDTSAGFRYQPADADPTTAEPADADTEAPSLDTSPAHVAFGTQGQMFWTFGGAVAVSSDNAVDTSLSAAWSRFIAKDVELSLEVDLWYYNQEGPNAFGLNPVAQLRWHFINRDPWSVYIDGGVGILVATDNVPEDGTSVDLTPRLGVGFTRAIGNGGSRLQAGVRWHHISNARITGEENNPSRDGIAFYAALMIPF